MVIFSLCLALAASATGPVALDNGAIRVEVEPRSFSVRFLGRPGGGNFLEPIHLTPTELNTAGWLEPGGLFTDVLPLEREKAVLRRGPAEVVEHRSDFLLLLGPEHPGSRWRIKKEFQLDRDRAVMTYKVTVQTPLREEREVRIRTTAQLAWDGAILVPGEPGRPALLRGAWPAVDTLLGRERSWYALPIIAREPRTQAVLSSPAALQVVSAPWGVWTRRLEIRSAVEGEEAESHKRTVALVDDASHTYQVALEAGHRGVNVGAPMIVIEHWSLEEPAPALEPDAPAEESPDSETPLNEISVTELDE